MSRAFSLRPPLLRNSVRHDSVPRVAFHKGSFVGDAPTLTVILRPDRGMSITRVMQIRSFVRRAVIA